MSEQPMPIVAIFYANPQASASRCWGVLERVRKTLDEAGAKYSLHDLYKDNFNPIMPESEIKNYNAASAPEDVKRYMSAISSSSLLIFIYPAWWSVPPAIMKGFIDRVFLPGFAFSYKGGTMAGLLEGKRALVIRTFAGGAEAEQKIGHVASNFMEKAVLEPCGIKSTAVDLYSLEGMAASTFEHYLFSVAGAVRRSLAPQTGVPHHLRWIPAPYLPPVVGSPKMQTKKEEKKEEITQDAKEQLQWAKDSLSQKKRGWVEGEGKRMISDTKFYDKGQGFPGRGKNFRQGGGASGESARAQRWDSGQKGGRQNYQGRSGQPSNDAAGGKPSWQGKPQQGGGKNWQGKSPPAGGSERGQGTGGQNQSRPSNPGAKGEGWQGKSNPPRGNRGTGSQQGRDKNRKHFSGDAHKRTKNYYGRDR